MFIDEITLRLQAGKGGDGCTSFKFIRGKKRRDGGDGGNGGSILIKGDRNLFSLLDFYYHRTFKAPDGKRGSSNNKTGRSGKDIIIKVPLGTLVIDKETSKVLVDIVSEDEVLICKGGRGGKGNHNTRIAQRGEEGEKKTVILQLKTLSDVGIVGLPNAGKSTLINALCKTSSKVASFPFTTKSPVLGVVWYKNKKITFADIPGIIEGASQGKGMGIKFLKHIERSKFILYLLDPVREDLSISNQYQILKKEMESYKSSLLNKKRIVVINKMDLVNRKTLNSFKEEFKDEEIVFISALKKEGVDVLLRKIYKVLKDEEDSN